MFTKNDIQQIRERGADPGQIEQQIEHFKNGLVRVQKLLVPVGSVNKITSGHKVAKTGQQRIHIVRFK